MLLDLNGLFSRGARPRILAARSASLQATHLGYGASTGARFIDLVLGDRLALPPTAAHSALYTEKFVLLPVSHLPAGHASLHPHMLHLDEEPPGDSGRAAFGRSAGVASVGSATGAAGARGARICDGHDRTRYALPPRLGEHGGGAVYAFLGQHLKIDADTFARWLSLLLLAPPRAALWMLRWPGSTHKLREQAAAAGVRTSRLVFAERMPQGEHLCAFRLADIALDSPSYSSGATGADVLWSGVPMLAMAGGMREDRRLVRGSPLGGGAAADSDASTNMFQRNAVSLVEAAGQPHLRLHSSAGYVEMASGVVRRGATLAELRRRATHARRWAPLFNTSRWAHSFHEAMRAASEVHAARQAMHVVCR